MHLTRMIAVVCVFLVSGALAAQELDLVLDQYERALGGREALESIQSMEAFGTIQGLGLTGTTYSLQKSPDMIMEKINIGPLSYSWAHTAETGWIQDQSGAVRPLSGAELEELLILSKVSGGIPIDDDLKSHMKVEPSLSDEDHICVEVAKGSTEIQLFFSKTTWLLEKVTLTKLGMPMEARFLDFRSVGGIVVPFKSVQTIAETFRLEMEIDSLHINVPIDEAVFFPPGSHHRTGGEAVCWIPMELGSHVVVPVSLNGRHDTRFFLDSGAGMSCVDEAYATDLELTVEGVFPAQGVVGYDSVGIATADSLTIGCYKVDSPRLAVVDLGPFQSLSGPTVQGLLGYDFFSRFIIGSLDDDTLLVAQPDYQISRDGFVEIPFEFVANIPVIEGFVNGHHGTFMVDTGNSFDLIVYTPFAMSTGLMPSHGELPGSPAAGIGGTGEVMIATVDSVEIGGLLVRDVNAIFSSDGKGVLSAREAAGNIGLGLLRQFDWILDYAGKRLLLRAHVSSGG